MTERLLELASRQADDAEVHLEESESRPIEFENNELKSIQTKSRRALSLRCRECSALSSRGAARRRVEGPVKHAGTRPGPWRLLSGVRPALLSAVHWHILLSVISNQAEATYAWRSPRYPTRSTSNSE